MAGSHRRAGRCVRPAVLAVLFGLLALVVAPPALANPFTELPAGHWAFDVLESLVGPGLISSQDLLDHRSREPVMRFELALLVSEVVKTLNHKDPAGEPVMLETLLTSYRVGLPGKARPLSQGEETAVRRLVAEFLPELEVLGVTMAETAPFEEPTPGPEPLYLDSASGPFVDLDQLLPGPVAVASAPVKPVDIAPVAAEVAESPQPAKTPEPEQSMVVTVPEEPLAAAVPGQVSAVTAPDPALPAMVAGDPGVVVAPTDAVPLLADALTRQGPGALPGRVDVDTQSTYAAVPLSKPVLAVDAAVQVNETRLPVPGVKVSVAPSVRVTSEVAPGGGAYSPAGSVQVQATVEIAGVEMGASVKNVQALESGTAEDLDLRVGAVPEQRGVGLSLRLGQVALMTDFSKIRKVEGDTERRRSFGLGYSLGSTAVLRADYQLVDLDDIGATKPRADASVGVNVNVTRVASVSAGMTLEGMRSDLPGGLEGQRTTAGVELRLPWNTFATAGLELYRPSVETAEVPSQSAATVGLGYNFAPNGTLLVGYRLIDFGTPGDPAEKSRQQSLTAGVSLSF